MSYFTKEFVSFFKELAKNNNKEWFHAHKKEYEEYVKKPFYTFIQDLINAMKEGDPEMELEVKNAVFRINRDIRFSKDKSPYKNFVAAAVSRGGRKDMQYPGIYVHLEPGNFMIAGGCFMPDKNNLQKLRQYIVDHQSEIEVALADKKFIKTFGGLAEGERNKILPAPFKEHGKEIPLLYNKQYYFFTTEKDESIFQHKNLVKHVMKHYEAGKVWSEVIKKALY